MPIPTIDGIAGVTEDPVLRFTQSGKAVLNIRLAFNDSKYDDQQQKWITTRTFYVDGTAWEQTAERLDKQLKKGDQVYVNGRLETQSWEQDGQKRSKPVLNVQTVRKLERTQSAPQQQGGFSSGQQQANSGWGAPPPQQGGSFADEPPF